MHRIDSSTATPDNRFTEGDPTIPIPATTVRAAWLNSVQEELIAILAAAGIEPDKANNAQVVDAINALIIDMTPIASVGVNGLVNPDGVTIKINATGKISAITQSMDPIGGIRFFEDEAPRAGYVPCMGTVISNFSTTYPEMAAYLSTSYGAARLVTLAQYNALHTATWATLADGSKVGWDGIGGVTKFVWDKSADTLKMPDLQEMFRSTTGASLGVGDVQGDQERRLTGGIFGLRVRTDATFAGILYSTSQSSVAASGTQVTCADMSIDSARQSPVGPAFAPRRWGALACCYLGQPAL